MKEYLIKEISNKPIILRQTKKLRSQLPRLIEDNEGRLVLYTDNISKFTNKPFWWKHFKNGLFCRNGEKCITQKAKIFGH